MANRRRFLLGLSGLFAAGATTKVLAETRRNVSKPTGQFIEIDGIKLHYRILGETGPKVVIVHGASGNLLDWTIGPALEIAKTNRILIFDRPGLGFSERATSDGSNLHVQAELIRKAAATLGWENTILIGHSYGGSVSLAWALDAPDTLSGLMLLAAPSHVWPTPASTRNRIAANSVTGPVLANLAAAFVPNSMIEDSVETVFAPQSSPPDYANRMSAALSLKPDVFQANASDIVALKSHIRQMEAQYERLQMPLEILHGTADTIVLPDLHSAQLAKRLPHANLQMLEGIGHMPHHSATDAMLAALHRLNTQTGA